MAYDIDQLLKQAFYQEASDIHLSMNSPPVYRIHGRLMKVGDTKLTEQMIEQMARHLLQNQWKTFEATGDFDFAYEIDHISRFRVNVFRQKEAVSIAARVIGTEIPSFEQLGLPHTVKRLTSYPHGLILVTGPTGSGKTTTLASMIDYINGHQCKHIITLEDPIEYFHSHRKSIIQQREVGVDTKQFSTGLRAALRQDPDIILVGEMRDLETIRTAITAAETGHLVFATLHTNSAAQTINRIIDVFPPHQQNQIRLQLASVLRAVISQRLFTRKDLNGRVLAAEILIGLPSVGNLIRNEKIDQINNIIQTSKASGMQSIQMSINELLNKGIISYKQAEPYL